ncbi:MAG: class II glutamine amidotransferase [Acidimicrobiales bacterium]
MCRLLAVASEEPTTLAGALGDDGLATFLALSELHPDGWGLAYLDSGSRVAVEKAPVPGGSDARLARLASSVASTGLVLHLRHASPGFPVNLANTHPFADGDRLAFAHNGALYGGEREIDLVPPALAGRREGTTDSECWFWRVVADVSEHGLAGGLALAAGAAAATCGPSSLNAAVLAAGDGSGHERAGGPGRASHPALAALAWYDPDKGPPHPSPDGGPDRPDPEYYRLRWRQGRGSVVVASSGWPQEGWDELANGTMLVLRPGSDAPPETVKLASGALGS